MDEPENSVDEDLDEPENSVDEDLDERELDDVFPDCSDFEDSVLVDGEDSLEGNHAVDSDERLDPLEEDSEERLELREDRLELEETEDWLETEELLEPPEDRLDTDEGLEAED